MFEQMTQFSNDLKRDLVREAAKKVGTDFKETDNLEQIKAKLTLSGYSVVLNADRNEGEGVNTYCILVDTEKEEELVAVIRGDVRYKNVDADDDGLGIGLQVEIKSMKKDAIEQINKEVKEEMENELRQ